MSGTAGCGIMTLPSPSLSPVFIMRTTTPLFASAGTTRRPMWHGLTSGLASGSIACCPKPNGNIAAGLGQERRTTPAKRSRPSRQTLPISQAAQRRSHAIPQIHWGSTTCMAMSRSGAKMIGTTTIRKIPRQRARFGRVATGRVASYAVVPGSVRQRNCVRPTAIGNDQPAASVL
jgi:hypothetical protein